MEKEKEMEKIVANLVRKVERRFYGKYRGFVKSNDDPEKLGRLLVTVPSVLGEEVAVWAFPCAPYGGMPNQGFFFIPEEKAGVWVEFEEGDPEFPIWVGTFWSKPGGKSEAPKPNGADGKEQGDIQKPPTSKIIKTAKGHTIQLEDKGEQEMVTIVEATHKHVITMDQNGIKITDGKNSGNKVTLDGSGVKVEDKNSNVIEMASGGVTITSSVIKLGGSGASEPFVLGNRFMAKVATFITALGAHTHKCTAPGNSSGPPESALTLDVPLSSNHKVQ